MDSKSILHYLLSFFIVLANVESNFGHYGKYDPALNDVDCHHGWGKIKCYEESKMEEQISKLKERFPSSSIALLFSNYHRYNYTMTSESFKGLKCHSLELVVSSVRRFTEKVGGPAFVGLEDTLQELTLSYINIQDVDAQGVKSLFSLSHLRILKELKIIHTNIQSFGNGYLAGSSLGNSLQNVDLSDNKITEIGDAAFASLESMKYIHLRDNKISTVERSMFPNPAPYLLEIYLNDNEIETLKQDIFENMPRLRGVDMRQNKFHEIAEATFKPIWSQLQFLSLDDVSCEEDDIHWMVKIRSPIYLHVSCKGEEHLPLEEKLERMRKEVQ